jgi:hypothetical protein
MNYSLKDLNQFIESEKSERASSEKYIRTFAIVDFRNTPNDEFLASLELCRYVKKTRETVTTVSYNEFRRLFESGRIDIFQLTSRQKLLFLTCLSASDCICNMVIASKENKEVFCKLRKILPVVVEVLRNKGLYTPEQVKLADNIAKCFMDCNRRLLNYRTYIDFVKIHL